MKYLLHILRGGWLLGLLLPALASGQNLVVNPGFEQYSRCRDSVGTNPSYPVNTLGNYVVNGIYSLGTVAPGWFSATRQNSIHVLACNTYETIRLLGPHYNGWFRPRTGGGYIIITTYNNGDGMRSYPQGQLTRPLQVGCTYRVSCWVRLPFTSEALNTDRSVPTASDNLAAYFTSARFGTNTTAPLLGRQPQATLLLPGQLVTDTLNYHYLSTTFVAQGGEQFFTLGNFQPDAATTLRQLRPWLGQPNAAYAIDDVSVEAVLPAGLALELGPDQWLGSCAGAGPATLTAPPGFQGYRWNTGQTTASIQVSQPGRYVVTADFGCGQVKDSVEVRRYALGLSPPLLVPPPALCPGQTVSITATPGFRDYQWADGPTGPARILSQPGRYYLTARTADGCVVRDSLTLRVLAPPLIPPGFPTDTLVCAEEPWRFMLPPALAGTSYAWSTGETGQTLYVPPGTSGTYSLTVRNRCQATTATVRVRSQECGPLLQIPNIVTPNGDGANDYFRLRAPSPRILRLQIFNRWGQPIMDDPNYHNQWPADARTPAGIYYYLVTDADHSRRYRGWVEVVR